MKTVNIYGKILFPILGLFFSINSHAGLLDFLFMPSPPKSLFPPDVFNKAIDQEEVRVGIGRFVLDLPKTYQEIFFEGKDFSDQIIQKNAQESEQFWSVDPVPELKESFSSHHFDFDAIRELNLFAAKTWNGIVACNSGKVSLARLNYFKGNPCGESSENTILKTRLSELNENYINFIKSTGLISFLNYNYEELSIPYQHPLLVQIELQALALSINSINEAKADYIKLLTLYGWAKSELIRNGGENEYIRKYKEQEIKEYEALGAAQWSNFVFNTASIVAANRFSNNRPLSESCSEFGLWPAMNRSILYFLDYKNSHNGNIKEIAPIANRMIQFLNKCGEPVEPFTGHSGTYSKFAYSHLYESKRLFGRYWNEKTNPEFSQVIDKSNTTPYQNLIRRE